MTKYGFNSFKVSHLGKQHTPNLAKRAPPDSCSKTDGTGPYQSPAPGVTIKSGEDVKVVWDKACFQVSDVNIYFTAPGNAIWKPHSWQSQNSGQATIKMKPEWFASQDRIGMQLMIVEAGQESFESPYRGGPNFFGERNPELSTEPAVTAAVSKGPTKGGVAAAVIFPLLFVGLMIAAYMKMARAKASDKSKRFSSAVDKRMSTISTDWKSMTPAGATAAVRNSMAINSSMDGGNRNSSFSFGQLRPSSTVAVEGGQAGVGARGLYTHNNGSLGSTASSVPASQMSQLRPGVGLRTGAGTPFADRVSRISFAADTRPSGESRRSTVGDNRRSNIASRAFHSSFVPPVPTSHVLQRQYSGDNNDNGDAGAMSPTQTQGPETLSTEEINARISGDHEIGPALSMMRHDAGDNVYLYTEAVPAPPPMTPLSPTHSKSNSPAGMMPLPTNSMSPDAMLRAYAARQTMSPQSTGNSSPAAPAASYNGNGMRTLYSPTTSNAQLPGKGSRYSMDDNDDDAYNMGTAS